MAQPPGHIVEGRAALLVVPDDAVDVVLPQRVEHDAFGDPRPEPVVELGRPRGWRVDVVDLVQRAERGAEPRPDAVLIGERQLRADTCAVLPGQEILDEERHLEGLLVHVVPAKRRMRHLVLSQHPRDVDVAPHPAGMALAIGLEQIDAAVPRLQHVRVVVVRTRPALDGRIGECTVRNLHCRARNLVLCGWDCERPDHRGDHTPPVPGLLFRYPRGRSRWPPPRARCCAAARCSP